MVRHSNALGLMCEYRWQTQDGKPRVVEHWTSDGEHYHFRYDFGQRTSCATDVLGRELEIQYNEDNRVIASRDFGGERYKIDFDAFGNIVGLTLPDGNPDATYKSKYLWWNTQAQVERYQDCSGKSTYYRYDERQHLVAVTDALNQTTTLERKPDGEVLKIIHPDGTSETFTYNTLGQVIAHTDGKGQTTRLQRNSRGLPSSRQDAKGQRIRYEYDKAIRLTALVNENNATYSFAYDASDRLVEEVRVDNLTRRFSYNVGGHLIRLDEIGYGENAERPERHTLFERDSIGRLVAKINRDASQTFAYDDGDRLVSIERQPTGIGKQLGVTEEKLEYAYDLLGRLTKEITPAGTLSYEYDPLSNLTTLTLPDGRKVNHLYYGSGHLKT